MKTAFRHLFIVLTVLLLAVFNFRFSCLFAQGSLTPPGAPAPMMKSLDQIEPRTIVNTANTPSAGFSMFTITKPGSYYLTTNVTGFAGANGIVIQSGNVILDLNGFTVQGVAGSLAGVFVNSPVTNVIVRNGYLNGWGTYGVDALFAGPYHIVLEKLRVSGSGHYGIISGNYSTVRDCLSWGNGYAGIDCTSGSVSDCVATDNGYGIYVGNGTIRDSYARYNLGNNFEVGDGSEVRGCVALSSAGNNTNGYAGIAAGIGSKVQDCTANGDSFGIVVGNGSSVIGCTALNNLDDGISAANNAVIKDCSACANLGAGLNGLTNCSVIGCTISQNTSNGLFLANSGNVRNCDVSGNGNSGLTVGSFGAISGCVINGNGGRGVDAFAAIRVTVNDCTVDKNVSFGIGVGGDSTITGCHVSANGTTGAHAAGINTLSGDGSRVDGNQVRDNLGYGIQASSGDVVVRNFAGNNSTNFLTIGGANFGPIQTASAMTNALGNVVF